MKTAAILIRLLGFDRDIDRVRRPDIELQALWFMRIEAEAVQRCQKEEVKVLLIAHCHHLGTSLARRGAIPLYLCDVPAATRAILLSYCKP